LSASLDSYAFSAPVQAGQPVVLGLRPESIRVGHEVGGLTPHAGRLKVVEPLGAQNIVWIECGGLLMSSIVDAAWQGEPGQPVAFGFDASRASLFDAQAESRL